METLSFWSLVMDGGYIMIPLAILLIVSIYVFTERCIAISRASKEDSTFMQRIRDYVHEETSKALARSARKTILLTPDLYSKA